MALLRFDVFRVENTQTSRLHIMKNRTAIYYAAASVALAAIVSISAFRSGAPRPADFLEEADAVLHQPSSLLPLKSDFVGPRTQRSAATALTQTPAHPTQSTFYPSITERVADWKVFAHATNAVTVAPYPDMPIEFTRVQLKDDGRTVTWIGTNPAIPGSIMVAVAGSRGTLDTVVTIPAASQVSLHTGLNGLTTIHESEPGDETCAVGDQHLALQPRVPTAGALRISQSSGYSLSPSTGIPLEQTLAHASIAAANTMIDVLLIYDAAALAWASEYAADARAHLEGQYRARLETGNVVLANSLITNFQWRFAGLVASSGAEPTSEDYNQIINAMTTDGPWSTWIRTQRHMFAADQVVFLKGGPSNAAGMAWAGSQSAPVHSSAAMSVVAVSSSYKTLIHELAHNLGCAHDRQTESAQDGNNRFNYGSMWEIPTPEGLFYRASTIMGYGGYVIPYFSTPNLTMDINPELVGAPAWYTVLNWGMQPLGFAEGHAKAADNARVLANNAATVAAFNEPVEGPPAITEQPADYTGTTGNSFILNVTATGGGLVYQWHKNGAPIAGATQSSYTRSMATTEDSGSYYVTVSNSVATQTSRTAAVAINSAPPPNSPPPSSSPTSGGGGGGGGAPSILFLMALGALAVGRMLVCRPGRSNVPTQVVS